MGIIHLKNESKSECEKYYKKLLLPLLHLVNYLKRNLWT